MLRLDFFKASVYVPGIKNRRRAWFGLIIKLDQGYSANSLGLNYGVLKLH